MKVRGEALALAVALSSGDEITLGPSDSALCSAALREYARKRTRGTICRWTRLPALVLAVAFGAVLAANADVDGDGQIRLNDLHAFAKSMVAQRAALAVEVDVKQKPKL